MSGPAAPAEPPPLSEGSDFVVYRADGAPASFDEIIAAAASVDVVFVGEEHNDPITHRVQAQILQQAFVTQTATRPVVLSLEMFERDVQYVVDEYRAGLITEDHFRRSSRPWDNYESDYRPMVEFAIAHDLEVVAANAPRRYVNRASRLGRDSLDTLGPEARRHLPPLPYPEASDDYQAEWDALMGGAAGHMPGSPIDGQTLWDASMGHAVATALDRQSGALVVHMAGGFHVENGTGTPEALEHYRPGTRALIVAARPAADPTTWDAERWAGLGDFVVLTRAPER
ncbi:MAG: ChaN family lipoprotein [Gemmatimonadetes bacterium]|nr:ChaN family lipoprotein [Gemmatimonadota bacterium]